MGNLEKLRVTLPSRANLPKEDLDRLIRQSEEAEHLRECRRCSGKDKRLPCILDPDFPIVWSRVVNGLPREKGMCFGSFQRRLRVGSVRILDLSAALDGAKAWADDPVGWLVLVGPPGVGKTHLALSVAEELLARRALFQFWQAARLLDFWRAGYDKGQEPLAHIEALDPCALVLDDLGAERPTPWAKEKLQQLLDRRWLHIFPTLITTNLDRDALALRMGESGQRMDDGGDRLADRVFDTGTGRVRVLMMIGPSYRTGKEWE